MSVNEEVEINMLKSFALLKNWLTEVRAKQADWTLQDYRQKMKENTAFFKPTFVLAWGDSFLLDQMFFRTGGNYQFCDFPELPVTVRVGDPVTVNGLPHVVTAAGLLTFNASRA